MPASPSTILLVAGSLRRGSHTTRLLEHAATLLTPPSTGQRFDLVRSLPFYDADLDGSDPPQPVRDARAAVAAAAGLVIATPEYNGALPGGLKNALDWISRPPREHVLVGKPVAVIGASPSPGGAARAATWLHETLGRLGAVVVSEPVTVANVASLLDADGALDAEVHDQLAKLVDALAHAAAA